MKRKIRKAGFLSPDNIMATFVLAGLPLPKYFNFVWSLKDDKQITMAAIKSKHLMEEKRSKPAPKKTPEEEGDEVTAMIVTSRRPVQENNSKMVSQSPKPFFMHKRYVICFAFGEKCHKQANCPRFEAERGERSNQEKNRRQEANQAQTVRVDNREKEDRILHVANVLKTSPRRPYFLLDSGASGHMSSDLGLFRNFRRIQDEASVADGIKVKVEVVGDVTLEMSKSCGGYIVTLTNVLYVPSLEDNLISLRTLEEKGTSFREGMAGLT